MLTLFVQDEVFGSNQTQTFQLHFEKTQAASAKSKEGKNGRAFGNLEGTKSFASVHSRKKLHSRTRYGRTKDTTLYVQI